MLQLATEKDWEAVQRLSVQVHDLHVSWRPDIYCHSEEPYPKELFLDNIQNRRVYVAKPEDTVAGYVVLSFVRKSGPGEVPTKALRLDSICVDAPRRGQGIGKAMMADVRALAKAFGCDQLLLGVYPENDGAVAFYQKCGFMIRAIHMDSKI